LPGSKVTEKPKYTPAANIDISGNEYTENFRIKQGKSVYLQMIHIIQNDYTFRKSQNSLIPFKIQLNRSIDSKKYNHGII